MSILSVFEKLKKYADVMEFNAPATEKELCEFNDYLNDKNPKEFKALLKCFNGGEIFIPGTIIYGVGGTTDDTVVAHNSYEVKSRYKIPNDYLVIGKMNFGDYICIDLNDNSVVQWDHENNEEFIRWDSLEDWLLESIDDYLDLESGE